MDSTLEVHEKQGTFNARSTKGPADGEVTRFLNSREVQSEFGLSEYMLYKLVKMGKLHPGRVNGEGRIYYSEWEVREVLSLLFGALGAAA